MAQPSPASPRVVQLARSHRGGTGCRVPTAVFQLAQPARPPPVVQPARGHGGGTGCPCTDDLFIIVSRLSPMPRSRPIPLPRRHARRDPLCVVASKSAGWRLRPFVSSILASAPSRSARSGVSLRDRGSRWRSLPGRRARREARFGERVTSLGCVLGLNHNGQRLALGAWRFAHGTPRPHRDPAAFE